jgi:hypothetical protein
MASIGPEMDHIRGSLMNLASIPPRLRGILKSNGRCLAIAIDHGADIGYGGRNLAPTGEK